jgi:RNA polymerase sigma factor (sigma-70 family)
LGIAIDDEELSRLKSGDAAAQGRFFAARRAELAAICQRIVGDRALSEELAEDVVIDFLFHAVNRVRHSDAVPAYLSLMAARRAMREREQRRRADDAPLEQMVATTPSPEDAAALRGSAVKLERCLGQLTPKARSTLKLRFGEDLAQEHIGQVLGGSKQYIGKLIRQSVEKLRMCLERQGITVSGVDK